MKTTLALLALFIIVLGGGYALYQQNHQYSSQTTPIVEDSGTAPTATSSITESSSASVSSETRSSTKTSGGTAPSTNPGAYTSAQVAAHNTSSSCWTSINGNVYDLTNWINQHPGGEGAILSICGRDGSAAFNAQHGGSRTPQQILASFKIGALAS